MSTHPNNITRHEALVAPGERMKFFGHRPATLWLTGLSGAGKSTVGFALEKALLAHGRACYVLDGDNVRHGLNKDLGFSPKDRTENIRRIAEVARLMNDAGLMVITAFISPYRDDRAMARAIVGQGNFMEVHIATDISVCESRDPKGLYAKARAGTIPEFTGVSAPYEAPLSPEITLDTGAMSLDQCVESILTHIEARLLG